MKNADLPAMPNPVEVLYDTINNDSAGYGKASIGLTKREMFAMHAMASWVNHHGSAGGYGFNEKEAARSAVECADALLEELSK
jgi:hypothetical protein